VSVSGFNVTKAAGGDVYGAVLHAPFGAFETIMQLGPLARWNVKRDGVEEGTDTFDFWWSNKKTGIFQDNLIWMANLLLEYGLSRYPTPETSPLYRLAKASSKHRSVFVGTRIAHFSVDLLAGYAIAYPNDRVSGKVRALLTMPYELRFTGVA